jgi:hypothetical protein
MRVTRRAVGGSRRTAMPAGPPRARKLSLGNVFIKDSFLDPPSLALPRLAGAHQRALHPGLSTPGMFRKLAHAEHLHAGFRDRVIVLDRAATYPNGPNENPILIDDRKSAREGNQPVI